ncbi:MAG: transposase [Pirellulaceae bacterium]|nr:transposase [Pirellulaceae bacterium]
MTPSPLYRPENIDSPSFKLRYTWTGWPSTGSFPPQPDQSFFDTLADTWETDGIRLLEKHWQPDKLQFTCSVRPTMASTLFTARVKARLQYALRNAGTRIEFSRKVAFRSLGENKREQVEGYIANQVAKAQFIDPRFAELIARYTQVNNYVSLREPTATNRGRYWYDLHLVLVTEHRERFVDEVSLNRIKEVCEKNAQKKGYLLGSISVMPDHVHLALRGNVEETPESIALGFMNNIAFVFGQQPVLRPGYYVGTFGEYDMGAVRR